MEDTLQNRVDGLFKRSRLEAQTSQFAPRAASFASGAGTSVAQHFSPFIPDQMRQAIQLASRFMEIADSSGLEAGIEEAEKAEGSYDLELVKFALLVFITHYPGGTQLAVLPLEERTPEKILPSTPVSHSTKLKIAADAAPISPEAQLAWYREDPKANEHHEHWHVVYPHAGVQLSPHTLPVLKDRQDELFFYMHQQMLARYDTERLALNLPRVVPLEDYTAPIPEAYEPGPYVRNAEGRRYFARPAGLHMANLPDYMVNDLAARRDRLRSAIASGFLTRGDTKVPLTTDLLGATVEASIGSVSVQPLDMVDNSNRFYELISDGFYPIRLYR
jgi:tyrosinase